MKNSRLFTVAYKGVRRLHVSADAVSDGIRSDNEPAEKHAKCRGIHEPLLHSRTARRSLWLISKHKNGRMEVFTIHPGSDRETLPIFSHEEEAEMFLWLGSPGMGWRARETTTGELVSLLYGPCANVGEVALDPLPLFGDEAMAGLDSLLREDFIRNLLDEREPRVPYGGSFEPEAPAGSESSDSFGRRMM